MWKELWKLIMKLSGWSICGDLPKDIRKYVIPFAPHTSNWDFFVGVMVRESMGIKGRFLGKQSLFKAPHGFIFRALGGIPVDRSSSRNMVEKIAETIQRSDEFILAIAPEGTRKKVTHWKTGFYYIAREADIPIIMAAMDYEHKEVRFSDPFYPTTDADADLVSIRAYFDLARGIKN